MDSSCNISSYGKVIFCNGMTTSLGESEVLADKISEIAKVQIELFHNDTLSSNDLEDMLVKVIPGIVIGLLGLKALQGANKQETNRKVIALTIVIAAAALIAWGIYDYKKVQDRKNESAQRLAGKVKAYLDESPSNRAALILHSQGADIGQRALECLGAYKSRISVLTIGGMIDIPKNLAKNVVNIVDDSDLIARTAKKFFQMDKHVNAAFGVEAWNPPKKYTSNKHCETRFCHGVVDYIPTPLFATTLQTSFC